MNEVTTAVESESDDSQGQTTTIMFRLRPALRCQPLSRRYATTSGPHALVFLEHREGTIDSGSLSALTAAQQLGGQVTGLGTPNFAGLATAAGVP